MKTSVLIAVLISSTAFAEPPQPGQIPQKARELAERGRVYHDAGEYERAIDAYREAYVLAPSPGLLFNLAQAFRLHGDCDDAAWMYRRYLDTNPPDARRALAEGHLATVEKCARGTLFVVTPPPHAAAVPDPVGVAVPSDTPPSSVHSSARREHVGIWIAIGGGAALAVAGAFAIDAHAAANDVTAAYAHGGAWSDIAATDERGRRSATIATAFGIAGGIAVAAGAVVYALGRHTEHAQHLALVPTPRGAEVHSSWQF